MIDKCIWDYDSNNLYNECKNLNGIELILGGNKEYFTYYVPN